MESHPFIEDEIKLLCSKGVRRLSDKTQVASLPRNPHIRNRLSHTGEVVACSVNIAQVLGLNTELARAIAIGHDIGHVPFGHAGEHYIAERTNSRFTHETMGVVIAQHIERKCIGLNLTHEVLEGMLRHSGSNAIEGMTQEAWVVRYADKIAYIFADFNDFNRMGCPLPKELVELVNQFGATQRERIRNVIINLCRESKEMGKVSFSQTVVAKRFDLLRKLMYGVYPRITMQDPARILDPIYTFLEKLNLGDPRIILGLMTDRDVSYLAERYALCYDHVRNTAVGEIIEHLQGKKVDCCDPDLDW
jgi:dGTPase